MILDILSGLIVLLYGFFGFLYGITGILINLAGILTGLIVSLMYHQRVAGDLELRFGLTPIASEITAVVLLFLLVTRAFYITHLVVRKVIEGDKDGPHAFLAFDHMAGAVYGFSKGVVLVLMLGWTLGQLGGPEKFPDSKIVVASNGTAAFLARGYNRMQFDRAETVEVATRAMATPRAIVPAAFYLATHPDIQALMASDTSFSKLLREGKHSAAFVEPGWCAIVDKPDVQEKLKVIGFPVDVPTGLVHCEDAGRIMDDLRGHCRTAWLRFGPPLMAGGWEGLVADKRTSQELLAGDFWGLLRNPEFSRSLGFAGSGGLMPGPRPAASTVAGPPADAVTPSAVEPPADNMQSPRTSATPAGTMGSPPVSTAR